MSQLKTKICRLCSASYIPDIYCFGDYCSKCSKINLKTKLKGGNKDKNGRSRRKTTTNSR